MTLEEKIVEYISKHYRGNKNAIPCAEIARNMTLVGYPTSAAEVQKMVSDIRRGKKAMIGSNSSGFFLIVTDEDMGITQAYIKNRIRSIVEAAEALDDMWSEKTGAKFIGDLFSGAVNDK